MSSDNTVCACVCSSQRMIQTMTSYTLISRPLTICLLFLTRLHCPLLYQRRDATVPQVRTPLPVSLSACLAVRISSASFTGIINSKTPPSFGFDSTPHEESSTPSNDVVSTDESLSSPLSPSKTPPPLPEKKRHSE